LGTVKGGGGEGVYQWPRFCKEAQKKKKEEKRTLTTGSIGQTEGELKRYHKAVQGKRRVLNKELIGMKKEKILQPLRRRREIDSPLNAVKIRARYGKWLVGIRDGGPHES